MLYPAKYTFIRNGVSELVDQEPYGWEAHYSDGTILKQFGDNGIFHQFKEIDQTKLAAFKMVSASDKPTYVVPFAPGKMKLIHFYRTVGLNFGTPDFKVIKACVFGYEQKVFTRVVKHLTVIVPNNEVILCSDTGIIDFK